MSNPITAVNTLLRNSEFCPLDIYNFYFDQSTPYNEARHVAWCEILGVFIFAWWRMENFEVSTPWLRAQEKPVFVIMGFSTVFELSATAVRRGKQNLVRGTWTDVCMTRRVNSPVIPWFEHCPILYTVSGTNISLTHVLSSSGVRISGECRP